MFQFPITFFFFLHIICVSHSISDKRYLIFSSVPWGSENKNEPWLYDWLYYWLAMDSNTSPFINAKPRIKMPSSLLQPWPIAFCLFSPLGPLVHFGGKLTGLICKAIIANNTFHQLDISTFLPLSVNRGKRELITPGLRIINIYGYD